MLPKTFCYSPEVIIDFCRQSTRQCSAKYEYYKCTTLMQEIKEASIPDKFVINIIKLKIFRAFSV